MTIAPILTRELRLASRRPTTYRSRFLAAAAAGLIMILAVLAALLFGGPTSPGGAPFKLLAGFCFFYCLIEGARTTSDCLSQEKREGTLGLLFLTDLHGYDVVLGKLASSSLRSFSGLLATFPFLGTSLLGGGVAPGEFWRMILVLTNTLFLSVTVSLCVSARSWDDRRALAATLCLLLLFLGCLPIVLEAGLRLLSPTNRNLAAVFSPVFSFMAAFDPRYSSNPSSFWSSLLLIHLLGWVFLLTACRILPRSWQDPLPVKTRSVSSPPPARPRPRAAPRTASGNPIAWLAGRTSGKYSYLWTYVAVVSLLGLALLKLPLPSPLFLLWNVMINLVLKVWLAFQASSSMLNLRRNGALELLLSTPLEPEDIWRGLALALRRMFLPPTLVLLGAELIQEVVLKHELSQQSAMFISMPWTNLGGTAGAFWESLTLLADFWAVGAVGIWLGLSQRTLAEAFLKTILYTVIVPTLLFCIPSLIIDVALLIWARQRLTEEFRTAARAA